MARMKPDSFDYYANNSNGEKRVFNALKQHLNDSWLVCHSWRWIRSAHNNQGRKSQGEGDFVLFHTSYGIIVIEVKGGTIEFREDGKYYSNGSLIQDPAKQASDTKYEIIGRLKSKKLDTECRVHYCVWFPDIEWTIPFPPSLNSTILLDKNALINPEPYLIHIGSSSRPISDSQKIEAIEKVLSFSFKLVKNLLFRIEDNHDEYLRLTNQQEVISRSLGKNPILGVKGRAGTGKTLIATHKAIEFSEMGKKVLYLCSGRGLAEFLQDRLSPSGVCVFTFHRYALKYLQKHHPARLPIDFCGSTADFDFILGAYSEVADENRDNYDVCIIDEAQDLKNDVFNELRKAFISKGFFYYFYDPLQIAFSRASAVEDPFMKNRDFIFELWKNMRNTVEVSKASLNIMGLNYQHDRDFSSLSGEPPTVVLIEDHIDDHVKKKIIELTIIDRIPKSLISILSMKGEGRSVCGVEVEGVEVITFRKFKGLDNSIVLLVDVTLQHFIDEVYERELYMAMTRSKYSVFLFVENGQELMKNEFCRKYNIPAPDAGVILNLMMENCYE